MKTSSSLTIWASSLALLCAPSVLATAATTSEEGGCTSTLITTLCDYPDPFRAVASDGRAFCVDYCHENQPCDFFIFLPGNPHTGYGTCWVYPGETFDPTKGSTEGCGNPYLEVYDKPVCPAPTTTGLGACEATASPSAVASVCDYPPPEDCFYSCKASSGAVNCLSLCAGADECSYAVFNPHGETNSPYEPGTCWIYSDGEYNPEDAGTCGSDGPTQYVYDNVCPKPPTQPTPSPSTAPSSGSSPATPDGVSSVADRATQGEEDTASGPAALSLTAFIAWGMAMLL